MKLSRKTIGVALIAAALLWCVSVASEGCLKPAVGELRWYRFSVVPLAFGVELLTYDGDLVCICVTENIESRCVVTENQVIFYTRPNKPGCPWVSQGVYAYNAETRKWDRSDGISHRSNEDRDAPALLEGSA